MCKSNYARAVLGLAISIIVTFAAEDCQHLGKLKLSLRPLLPLAQGGTAYVYENFHVVSGWTPNGLQAKHKLTAAALRSPKSADDKYE